MVRKDIAIIGGGPAGAMTAIYILKNDPYAKVTIYEAREKPRAYCAGGIGYNLLAKLDFEPLEWAFSYSAQSNIYRVTLDVEYGDVKEQITVTSKDLGIYPLGVVVDRARFDWRLLMEAVRMGAKYKPNRPVKFIGDGVVFVDVNGTPTPFPHDIIIDARGYSAWLPSQYRVGQTFTWEVFVDREPEPETIKLHLPNEIMRGYVWEFPGDGYTKFGFGEDVKMYGKYPSIREKLIKKYGYEGFKVKKTIAAVLPLYGEIKLYDGHAFRVGTAAGLINPLHGGGIAYALIHGKALGEALVSTGYRRRLTLLKLRLNRKMNYVMTEIKLSKRLANVLFADRRKIIKLVREIRFRLESGKVPGSKLAQLPFLIKMALKVLT